MFHLSDSLLKQQNKSAIIRFSPGPQSPSFCPVTTHASADGRALLFGIFSEALFAIGQRATTAAWTMAGHSTDYELYFGLNQERKDG